MIYFGVALFHKLCGHLNYSRSIFGHTTYKWCELSIFTSLGPFRRLKSSPLIFHCFYFPNFLIYMAFFFYLIMVSRLIGYLSFLGSLQNYHSSHNAVYHNSYTQFLHLPSCATCHRVYS